MITLRLSSDRGKSQLDWLDSKHTFSFADYHDPNHMGFAELRVINEDIVAPGLGFGSHPHRDMEIITYIISGALEHRDSMGTGEVIRRGEVQRMSAGTGVTHSEFNHSKVEPVHLLQIWIIPEARGISPGYEQKKFELGENKWQTLANQDGSAGALTIHQKITLQGACLKKGKTLNCPGQKSWIQVVQGTINISGVSAESGDGIALTAESDMEITANSDCELLLFDLS